MFLFSHDTEKSIICIALSVMLLSLGKNQYLVTPEDNIITSCLFKTKQMQIRHITQMDN